MINAKIETGKIEITGHANYAPHGKDIVCAAVSALAQSAALAIAAYDATAQLEAVEGHLKVEYTADDHYIDGITDTLKIGLDCIAGQYGEFLKIEN